MPQSKIYDVIIVGSGAVGLTACYMLGKKGLQVALVDRLSRETLREVKHDDRAFAFAYGSKLILDTYGLFEPIRPYAHPINNILINTENSDQQLNYVGHKVCDHPMGYNVETWAYRQHLLKEIEQIETVDIFDKTTVDHIEHHKHFAELYTHNGSEKSMLRGVLIVAADGKDSFLRKLMAIPSYKLRYDQTALVTTVTADPDSDCQDLAVEHFTPQGPVALLPLGVHDNKGRFGIIWSMDHHRLEIVRGMNRDQLSKELCRFFNPTHRNIVLLKDPSYYPIEGQVVRKIFQHRVLLMGDAAHAIHPVAGQGFNLGLRDAACLAKLCAEHQSLGSDLGSYHVLKVFERTRRVDHLSMTAMCHGLVRLFSNDLKSLAFLRSTGLGIVNHFSPLKRRLTRHAMGL